jgi:hypothetical protein
MPAPYGDPPILRLHVLLHHDGVGARRHHAARHDPHAFTGRHGSRVRRTGECGAGHPQRGLPSGLEIAETDGIPVHRGIVMGRNVDRREEVLSEHPVERVAHVQPFAGVYRMKETRNDLARLVDRHRIRIVIVGAGQLSQGLGRFVHREVLSVCGLLLMMGKILP